MSENWTEFYQTHRLQHQFQLAERKGDASKESTNCWMDRLFLSGILPETLAPPWRFMGWKYLFRPPWEALYFRPCKLLRRSGETDLAFTYMFGGFFRQFYDGYQSVYPINDGFSQRKILYNLYLELNHFNLFGGGYANSAQSNIHS